VTQLAIEVLESVTSTMDVARENILSGRITFDAEGLPSMQGVLAYEQTAGRGQRGRSWYAPKGESLCVTYYVRHKFDLPEQAGRIALVTGVLLAHRLQGETIPGISLKWPNDILREGRKAGGVLVEMVKAPDGEWAALVGIGLNIFVREFPPELEPAATSLFAGTLATGSSTFLNLLAQELGEDLQTHASRHNEPAFQNIIMQWRAFDGTTGRIYETEWNGETVTGAAEGIDDAGALRLRLESGERIAVTSASSLRERT
jgi:BirA family biotin operon repressor/biotin-[acetyl-CoA-carboxylase] ligase